MVPRFGFIVGSVALIASMFTREVQAGGGQIIQLVDSTNFCTFLPPAGSTDRIISNTEWNAQAYCMGNTPEATNANKLPDGFILSAHYVATDDYVQITGQIDPSKAQLDPSDDGGQYDIKAPNGASCVGYDFFVNLIEPTGDTYCIRCCHSETNCNRGISQKGCARIVPGDFSGPGVPSSGSSSGSSSSSSAPSSQSSSDSSSAGGAQPSDSASSSSSSSSSDGNVSASAGVSAGVSAGASAGASSADGSSPAGASAGSSSAAQSSSSAAGASSAGASSAVSSAAGSPAAGSASADANESVTAQSVDSGSSRTTAAGSILIAAAVAALAFAA